VDLAYQALGKRFSKLWEKKERDRQRAALEKLAGQQTLKERYPGITSKTVYGSPAGALGIPQGMPAQSVNLMSDWVAEGIYDPWGNEASIAEFTIRYLIRTYAKSGRMAAWESYNPNGMDIVLKGGTTYRQVLKKTARRLESSWQVEFRRQQLSADVAEGTTSARRTTSEVVLYQVGWSSDTLLLRTLRWSKSVEETTGDALGFLESMEEISPFIGSENLHRVLVWLVRGLHYPAKWSHTGSLFIAQIAYGEQDVASSEIRQARREQEPVSEDVVVEMDLWARHSTGIADNIRWILARRSDQYKNAGDPALKEAELN